MVRRALGLTVWNLALSIHVFSRLLAWPVVQDYLCCGVSVLDRTQDIALLWGHSTLLASLGIRAPYHFSWGQPQTRGSGDARGVRDLSR